MIEVLAPARICLFGDHQDYLGLPVIACAIDRYIKLSAIKNKSNSLKIDLPDIGKERVIPITESFISIGEQDYFVKALEVLKEYDCIPDIGFDIVISGDVPINAGLSSSSAIVVAWTTFLLKAFGKHINITSELIAKLTYRIEVLEFNSPGGLMDQYSISIGNTIFINTISGEYERFNKPKMSLIIGESGFPKKTLSVLKNLREFAQEAISVVQSHHPNFTIEESERDDYKKYYNLLSDELKPIFYAAIKNYHITKEAYSELKKEIIDVELIGKLMNEHHKELKENLKITVPIIDTMIAGAINNGALGAKIVGSGGGGCIVAITSPENENTVIQGILNGGAKKAYKVEISNGVL
ncbi:MAG: galactokinase [Lutibacter sp.]|nr:MAG: galactokinase [Lutibacter sp.]